MSEHIYCEDCAEHREYEVDAQYRCDECESDICFDHMKVWPQPKWEKTKPIHYCKNCYQYRWTITEVIA